MRRAACLGVLAAALLALPAGAGAGTYRVSSCLTPDNRPAGLDGWTRETKGAESVAASYCSRGSFWIVFTRASKPHPVGDRNEAVFTAPPGTTIASYTLLRSVTVMESPSFDYSYELLEGHRSVVVESCHGQRGCHELGAHLLPVAPSNLFHRAGLSGVRKLWLSLACRGTTTCGTLANDSPMKLWLHKADIELEDTTDPQFAAAPAGSLLRRGPLAGVRTVTISATDVGGGVRDAIAEIDGREVARVRLDANGGRCEPPFTAVVPCKNAVTGTLAVDTAAVPDGDHVLRLRVTDATGTNSAEWGPVPIRVMNACEPRARDASLRLRARVGKRGRRVVRTRFGRRPLLRGRLVTADGRPVAGAAVCLASRTDLAGASRRAFAWAATDARGRFTRRLPAGPSRRVLVVHRTAAAAAWSSVSVRVRAGVRLRPSRRSLRNGEVVRLRGRLRGGPVPRGAVVELQARRGSGWQTFATTKAGRSGRFSHPYRFTRTTGFQRYVMRARVPRQPGYPYEPGASRPVAISVRG
jgi:hypothetical protein